MHYCALENAVILNIYLGFSSWNHIPRREVAREKLVKYTEWKLGYPKVACGSNLITIENGLIYIILIYQFVCFLLSVERIFTIRLAVPSIAYKLY